MREFLVYHKIPRSTILNTFTVRELLRLTATDSSIAAMLRLDILGSRMHSYHKTVRPDLEKQNFQLNEDTVVTLARFARFLHLGMNSPAEHLMHLVSDVIQGWGVKVKYHAPEQWLSAANVFATSLGQAPASMKQYQQMKIAFLDGVRWSQGEFNTRHSDEKMRIMLGRAIKIGLQDPAKLICEELDGAKLNVMLYDKKQQKVLEGAAARALPQGAAARNGAGLTLSAGDATTDSEDEEMILYDNQDD